MLAGMAQDGLRLVSIFEAEPIEEIERGTLGLVS
jgi:hypothetical protein